MAVRFARGCRGEIVRKLQTGLTEFKVPAPGGGEEPALPPEAVDGDFGKKTLRAVQRVQAVLNRSQTGDVDKRLWQDLTGTAWPSEFERSLALLVSFEGHGYTEAAGNADGAGITWGIVGFILIEDGETSSPAEGSLTDLLRELYTSHRDKVVEAFGETQADELEKALKKKNARDLQKFAISVSDPSTGNTKLLPSWQEGFRRLGMFPEIQKIQGEKAKKFYDEGLKQADEFIKNYAMDAEQTRQFFFDVSVNNGSLTANERKLAIAELDRIVQQDPKAPLKRKLLAITDVLIKSRKPKLTRIIRTRKGTIANGYGEVNKTPYHLEGWGIQTEPEPDLALGILSFEPLQVREQLHLASAVAGLLRPEPAVAIAQEGRWPTNNGTDFIGSTTNRSLTFRKLLGPESALVESDSRRLADAINLAFRHPIGVLALFGQARLSSVAANRERYAVIGRGRMCYAGVMLDDEQGPGASRYQRLRIVRQLANKPVEDVYLDISGVESVLAECQIVMLYIGFGIGREPTSSPGKRWQNFVGAASGGRLPIVLGWYGATEVPKDSGGRFVAEDFFRRVKAIANADLKTICSKYSARVVQAWGEVCYASFANSPQRHLWHSPALFGIDFTASGAAAIDPSGRHWYAKANYAGAGDAMVAA